MWPMPIPACLPQAGESRNPILAVIPACPWQADWNNVGDRNNIKGYRDVCVRPRRHSGEGRNLVVYVIHSRVHGNDNNNGHCSK